MTPEIPHSHNVFAAHVGVDFLFHGAHVGRPSKEYLDGCDVADLAHGLPAGVGADQHGFDCVVRRVELIAPASLDKFGHAFPYPGNNRPTLRTLDDTSSSAAPSSTHRNNSHDFILLACEPTGRPSPVELSAGSGT